MAGTKNRKWLYLIILAVVLLGSFAVYYGITREKTIITIEPISLIEGETEVVKQTGTGPFKIIEYDHDTVTISPVGEDSLKFTAKKEGKTTLVLQDRKRRIFSRSITVIKPSSNNEIALTIEIGESARLRPDIGSSPYTVEKFDQKIIRLVPQGTTEVLVIGKAVGETLIGFKNADGQYFEKRVKVIKVNRPPLRGEFSHDTGQYMYFGEECILKVSGGKPPYTVDSENPEVLAVTRIGSGNYRLVAKEQKDTYLMIVDQLRSYIRMRISIGAKKPDTEDKSEPQSP